MDVKREERIARIIERRRAALATFDDASDHHDQDRHLAHERVLAELPRFLTKISGAVLELNDQISDAHVGVRLKALEHTPSAEAIYVLSVVPALGEVPVLVLNIDYTGKLNALLEAKGVRKLIKTSSVFQIDRSEIVDLLLSLMEAQYD